MDGTEEPPDIMDVTITKPAPDMAQIGLDGAQNSHSAKRQKLSSNTYDGAAASPSSEVVQAAEENVLPTVNSSAICSGCDSQIKDIAGNIITCSSCSKKFHATCPTLEALNKRVKVMPSVTNIRRYNEMCRSNIKYLGGAFSWCCASCEMLKNTANNDLLGDRLKLLESFVVQAMQDRPLKKTLENVLKELTVAKQSSQQPITAVCDNSSSSCSSTTDIAKDSTVPLNSNNTSTDESWPAVSNANNNKTTYRRTPKGSDNNAPRKAQMDKVPSKFKIVLTNSKSDVPIRRVLGKYASNGTLKQDYQYKSRGKDTIELLFKSQESALAEYNILRSALTDIDVNYPIMAKARRAYLVGLEDYHDSKNVLEEIERKYGDVLQLNSVNKSCLKILEINPCNNNDEVFRATLELSEELLLSIDQRLGNKLRIGFVGCTVYPFRNHDRCNKCQDHTHKWKDCKADSPTCANCAGNHYTSKCTSNLIRCCNCLKHEKFKNNADGHKASSTDCPVFLEHSKQASKKDAHSS